MILVIGGAHAGKADYVRSLGYTPEEIADAVLADAPALINLHILAARHREGAMSLLPGLLAKEIITCDEVGSGVVPVDASERALREDIGRLCVALAREAHAAVRVIAGIPIAIKGELPCAR